MEDDLADPHGGRMKMRLVTKISSILAQKFRYAHDAQYGAYVKGTAVTSHVNVIDLFGAQWPIKSVNTNKN